MASVGSIIGGGFRVVRDRPGAVVVWGVTYAVGLALLCVLLLLLMGGTVGMSALRDPSTIGSAIGGMLLGILVFYLGLFLLAAVVMNAVFRTVLRRDEWSGASLRLGGDEWRVFGLQIIILIASLVVSLVAGLLISLISVALMGLSGQNMFVGIVIQLIYTAFWIWLSIRISLFAPMTFYRRRFAIDEAWSLTGGGAFWTLLGAFLVVGLIFLAIFGTLFWWAFGPIFLASLQHPGDPTAAREVLESFGPAAMMGRFGLIFLVWIILGPIAFAVWNGMIATATRELLTDRGEVMDDAESTAAIFE